MVPDRYFLPEVMGGGIAWLDFDRDGRIDLYAVNGCRIWDRDPAQMTHVNRMFRNSDGNHFDDVTFLTGPAQNRYGQGAAVGDYNSDGFPDLYLANYGSNVLLANNGDGTFSDETADARVDDPRWSTSVVWFDANGDGLLDLYVVNYLNVNRKNHKICTYDGKNGYCGPGGWDGGVGDVLFLNSGDGRFKRIDRFDGVDSKDAKGLAVAVCDFDGDGLPEVYVANDMAPNFLLTHGNRPNRKEASLYRNIANVAGCAQSGDGTNEASMGISCADFDGDGRVDIFLSHYYRSKNTVYRNLGNLRFEDESHRSRIAATSFATLSFGTVPLDVDWDGDLDLFIANGHVLGPAHRPYQMKAQILSNDGSGKFTDVSATAGDYFQREVLGRGVAAGDFDNDGRIDVAVSHVDAPLALLRNETATRANFIGLDLLPRNRCIPVGARIVVRAGSKSIPVPVVAGGSYLSTSDSRISLGLAGHSGPVDVTITWPQGRTEKLSGLAANRYWLLREGSSPLPAVKE